ncbi:alpha/beta-hydrolase [Agrocybe pediades]|nr:alpha/beta-hydrolase [Agrocybe pediades]
MPVFGNTLTRDVSLKVGPVILDVLVKHYFDRLKSDTDANQGESTLKKDDVLYHEAFTIVKAFLHASTFHTIEELQSFSNTRTPSPPWTHVVRILVPISCCDDAAPYLIKALGGEEVARRLVGGIKWWQVRGINGVDAQWLTSKKDWEDSKRRHKKEQQDHKDAVPPAADANLEEKSEGVYEKKMDAMRCILYLHGGGYYFGSVDQERYSIQRFARKINGRVFAINYRLAPQYPFPCGLQDAIAAYLYLIRPPPGSAHQPVDPKHIIISGDSAGGGLSLALLQVIRDSGLPAPAGGVLISPWCDLTHSFPSIMRNTDTDVVPESGMSFHKPSLLWPPPSQEVSSRVHASLRFRIRQAFRSDDNPQTTQESTFAEAQAPNNTSVPLNTPTVPVPSTNPEKVVCETAAGEIIEVEEQLHFYAMNSLLTHPLISPCMSYLGGLPPLLFIAGDQEVLRDEIIYTAHKAAYPEKYPVTDRARELYPSLNGIEERFKPTSVHLQVYDESPHILPILFSFTTPAKFCFRAIATFCKLVTGITPVPSSQSNFVVHTPPQSPTRGQSFIGKLISPSRHNGPPKNDASATISPPTSAVFVESPHTTSEPEEIDVIQPKPSLPRTLSSRISRVGAVLRRQTSFTPVSGSTVQVQSEDAMPKSKSVSEISGAASTAPQASVTSTGSDVGGHRFKISPSLPVTTESERRPAGDIAVYAGVQDAACWDCGMIRERVATSGFTRPLECEEELDAIQMPAERIGRFSEATMNRYTKARAVFDKKFAHTSKSVEKHRRRNLERAKKDTIKQLGVLKQSLKNNEATSGSGHEPSRKGVRENVISSPGWGWAWALDENEDPPPSSIVSRRDTEEARKLAQVADQAVLSEDQTFSANNLWSVVINFLTVTPGKPKHTLYKSPQQENSNSSEGEPSESHSSVASSSAAETTRSPERRGSKLTALWKRPSPKRNP